MKLEMFQVDAFADRLFGGNPAAVVPLTEFLPDEVMQAIALENNLSETAFIVPAGDGVWDLRWFTPSAEVELCGHATLGTAHVLFGELGSASDSITFKTKWAGDLTVKQNNGCYEMNLPAYAELKKASQSTFVMGDMVGSVAREVHDGQFLMAVYDDPELVRNMRPTLSAIREIKHDHHPGSLLVTAPGDGDLDFVSRFFAPGLGIAEDPVTGSAHCQLAPYWAEKLGKTKLRAEQASRRSGIVECEVMGDRMQISGPVKTYLRGTIEVPL